MDVTMLLTLIVGRRFPRPPVLIAPDAQVEVLEPDNRRVRMRAADLRPGCILHGLGVLVRVEGGEAVAAVS